MYKYVIVAVMFAQRQAERDRFTRYGLVRSGRRVDQDAILEEIAEPAVSDSWADENHCRQVRIVKRFIRERLQRSADIELVERHLFEGLPIKPLSEMLNINYENARTVVSRTRRYLLASRDIES